MNTKRHEWAMKAGLATALMAAPTLADDAALLDRALTRATATFEAALPQLGASEFGVDVAAYRDALTLGQFSSRHWGGTVSVETAIRDEATGSCGRYAAFVRIPPENGVVSLVLCPQFFTDGADGLRELTILHEMVHVVAGSDECQAMAFAARVQEAVTGTFTPVSAYWEANGCAGTGYSLP
ncbi:hypothetical protein [Devosia sp. SL43]|uniref:hypothetical protein n=1 Tax=Devosia sp. SL43 TaxID=2806348 RepID=UPI001F3D8B4D|nr:hypothetical protein [Devosia sp. SL43]UJW84470.1 hypothetical protein IM737_13660 [Devosia sp. SL43]